MSNFALTLWAWQLTGSATALALVGFFSLIPRIFVSLFASIIVDRANRQTFNNFRGCDRWCSLSNDWFGGILPIDLAMINGHRLSRSPLDWTPPFCQAG